MLVNVKLLPRGWWLRFAISFLPLATSGREMGAEARDDICRKSTAIRRLPNDRRAPHPRTVWYMLLLMLPFIMLRRAPYPYTALLILLLTRKLCGAGEYAYDFS